MSGPFGKSNRSGYPDVKANGLFVLFGLLFRRRQAFETLQKFLLGHALDGNLSVVGVDA